MCSGSSPDTRSLLGAFCSSWVAPATSTAGGVSSWLTSLIYAVSEAPKNGWASPATLGTAGLGAVLLGIFVAHERRASAPLVPLPILYRRAVAVPNAAVVLKSMVGAALLYVLTLYFQDALGHTPLESGLLFVALVAVFMRPGWRETKRLSSIATER